MFEKSSSMGDAELNLQKVFFKRFIQQAAIICRLAAVTRYVAISNNVELTRQQYIRDQSILISYQESPS